MCVHCVVFSGSYTVLSTLRRRFSGWPALLAAAEAAWRTAKGRALQRRPGAGPEAPGLRDRLARRMARGGDPQPRFILGENVFSEWHFQGANAEWAGLASPA